VAIKKSLFKLPVTVPFQMGVLSADDFSVWQKVGVNFLKKIANEHVLASGFDILGANIYARNSIKFSLGFE
jgi:hypothetical protein